MTLFDSLDPSYPSPGALPFLPVWLEIQSLTTERILMQRALALHEGQWGPQGGPQGRVAPSPTPPQPHLPRLLSLYPESVRCPLPHSCSLWVYHACSLKTKICSSCGKRTNELQIPSQWRNKSLWVEVSPELATRRSLLWTCDGDLE